MLRQNGGCTDSNDNAADFTKAAVSPRNSASANNNCTTIVLDGGALEAAAPDALTPDATVVEAAVPDALAPDAHKADAQSGDQGPASDAQDQGPAADLFSTDLFGTDQEQIDSGVALPIDDDGGCNCSTGAAATLSGVQQLLIPALLLGLLLLRRRTDH